MSTSSSLARGAVLALALMIGFYVLALAIAGGLLWIPYAEWIYFERVHGKIALACIATAGGVVWAVLPRVDRFEPPGPRLEESDCPALFAMIREVAAATGQEPPADVYLVNEVNAWVTQRGGVMGFGSKRVMGIGLPLMQGLSQAELRAVIAHEFGHYSSGDVSLGPWIYKTRAAIGRAVQNLEESIVSIPFLWYGTLFLRVTHAVSRQQEFTADAVAAKVAGAPVMASALRRLSGVAMAFNVYMGNEVSPVLRAGFLPPVASGFDQYLRDARIVAFARAMTDHSASQDTTDPYDTHPSLKQRLEALGASGADASDASADPPAASLLPNPESHAAAAVRAAWARETVETLTPLDWSAVGDSVYVPEWRAKVKHFAKLLAHFTPETLPKSREELLRVGVALVRSEEPGIDDDVRTGRAVHVLGIGLGVLLVDQGWRVTSGVGEPVVLVRGGETIDPFGVVDGVAKGELAEWPAQASAAGISGRVLGGSGVVAGR